MNKHEIHALFKMDRGIELLKCFEDMSLRDAGNICKMSFSTMRLIKNRLGITHWGFPRLKGEAQEKWEIVKQHRERIMQVIMYIRFSKFFDHCLIYILV
jgi:hypothetical protein